MGDHTAFAVARFSDDARLCTAAWRAHRHRRFDRPLCATPTRERAVASDASSLGASLRSKSPGDVDYEFAGRRDEITSALRGYQLPTRTRAKRTARRADRASAAEARRRASLDAQSSKRRSGAIVNLRSTASAAIGRTPPQDRAWSVRSALDGSHGSALAHAVATDSASRGNTRSRQQRWHARASSARTALFSNPAQRLGRDAPIEAAQSVVLPSAERISSTARIAVRFSRSRIGLISVISSEPSVPLAATPSISRCASR